jgi:hypothetical protein
MFTNDAFRKLLVAIFVGLSFAAGYTATAQDEDESKAIKAEVFIKDRPTKPAARRSTVRYRPAVKIATDPNSDVPPRGMSFAQVGVTFWRFRPATAADKTKELVEDEEGSLEWTLERIEEGTPLAPGQRVRLSVESLTRTGYLYVIDREQYADGTLGDPVLIFPTQKTRDVNYVKPGRLVYLPSASGKFRIKPSDGPKPHVGELITVIISKEPLVAADQLGPRSIKLPRQQVETWEKQWGVATTRFEMTDGAGTIMTEKEQAAGTNVTTELTQDDPVPQTVYRLVIKPENPFLFSVPMKFRR